MKPEDYDLHFCNHKRKEYILCAAIWYQDLFLVKDIPDVRPKNINTGIVILGHRHGQCIWTMSCLSEFRTVEKADDATGKHIQGFLTSKNNFLNRKEAATLAFEVGQINEPTTQLFSEDLY
jgi:hypothetical protein